MKTSHIHTVASDTMQPKLREQLGPKKSLFWSCCCWNPSFLKLNWRCILSEGLRLTDCMPVFVSVYVSVSVEQVQKAVSPSQFKKKKDWLSWKQMHIACTFARTRLNEEHKCKSCKSKRSNQRLSNILTYSLQVVRWRHLWVNSCYPTLDMLVSSLVFDWFMWKSSSAGQGSVNLNVSSVPAAFWHYIQNMKLLFKTHKTEEQHLETQADTSRVYKSCWLHISEAEPPSLFCSACVIWKKIPLCVNAVSVVWHVQVVAGVSTCAAWMHQRAYSR